MNTRGRAAVSCMSPAIAAQLAGAIYVGFTAEAQPAPGPRWEEFPKLDAKAREVLVAWLSKDCEATEKRRLIDEIVSLGTRLEPALREAHGLGPPQDRVCGYSRRAWTITSSGGPELTCPPDSR